MWTTGFIFIFRNIKKDWGLTVFCLKIAHQKKKNERGTDFGTVPVGYQGCVRKASKVVEIFQKGTQVGKGSV